MTTDFRALCVELLDCLEKADWPHKQKHVFEQWVYIARKVLAEPEPEGPTDDALLELYQGPGTFSAIEYARAVLARWGNHAGSPDSSTPQPVPVSERLPGPGDCDAEGRCWLCGKVEGDWRLLNPEKSGVPQLKYCFSHWLPAHALPVPS